MAVLRKAFLLFMSVVIASLAASVGCGDPPADAEGGVVVGVTSDLRAGVDIDRLHVVMRAGGEVLRDTTLTTQDGRLRFPTELWFGDLEDGTAVEIELEAFGVGGATKPLLTRAASTEVVGGKKLLLRVRLESACVIAPGEAGCAAPETCIAGVCRDPHVSAASLEPYSPAWDSGASDVCKPPGGGEPVVVVGEGQGDYLPLQDLDEAQVEAGPQGGHHIWIAIRMKNLKQSGSITTLTGYVPSLDLSIQPFSVIFTFDPDEGGYCKLHGLRFQLDGDVDIQELLGRVVNVTVKVTDPEGAVGTGEVAVTLSQTIL